MAFTKIEIENITVFDKVSIPLNPGINVLLGENGMGKTHVMKLLYAACQAAKKEVSFPHKTVMLFRPEDFCISRIINRSKGKEAAAQVRITANSASLRMNFDGKTKKWDAEETGSAVWEKQMADAAGIYIPAKEILSNAWNLEAAVKMGNVEFDDTYLDVIAAAKINLSASSEEKNHKKLLAKIQKICRGKVVVDKERFYLKAGNQARLEFNLIAEGMRKIALIWQLIKNGTLQKGSVLFWDEPEANINPKYIPLIADILLELQREGVQIFLATHDYFLVKYLEVRREQEDKIQYIALYQDENKAGVQAEIAPAAKELEHNSIMETFMALYHEEIRKVME